MLPEFPRFSQSGPVLNALLFFLFLFSSQIMYLLLLIDCKYEIRCDRLHGHQICGWIGLEVYGGLESGLESHYKAWTY